MNRNAVVQDYLKTKFTPKRSKRFFLSHCGTGYRGQSAFKASFDINSLGHRLMNIIKRPMLLKCSEMPTAEGGPQRLARQKSGLLHSSSHTQ